MSDPIFQFISYNTGGNQIPFGHFSANSNMYMCYSESNNKLYVYQLGENKPFLTLGDFTQRPMSCHIPRKENFLVVGMDSGLVKIYETSSGNCLRSFQAHKTAVTQICCTNNSLFMATGCIDGQVKFWDLEQHELIQDINPLNALVQNTKQYTTEVSNPQISALAFDYAQTQLYIGDMSGRVLIWSLTQLQFIAEFMLNKQINSLHVHQTQDLLFGCSQNQLNIFELKTYQCLKQVQRQYVRVFTPLKNNIVAGIRPSGLDVMDMDGIETEDFIIEQQEYNFKQALFCCERKTSSVPQLLVFKNDPQTGSAIIDVCSLKLMRSFAKFLPGHNTQLPPSKFPEKTPQNCVQAQPATQQPPPPAGRPNASLPGFLRSHNVRQKQLDDRLLLLKQVNNTEPIQSAIQLGDINVFMAVYSNISLNKLDLKQATQIVTFLTNQIQIVSVLSVDQVQFSVQTVGRLGRMFEQVVNEADFIHKNNRGGRNHDLSAEERYERTRDFKLSVITFNTTLAFLQQQVTDTKIAIKLQAGIDELKRLNWKE